MVNKAVVVDKVVAVNQKKIEWVVLTKAPVAGTVKTRLIPALGKDAALEVYVRLLLRLEKTLKKLLLSSDTRVALWIAGDMQHSAFDSWREFPFDEKTIRFCAQDETGDLGQRMAHAVQSSLARGFIPVLVGVDVPDLNQSYLLNCLQQLQQHDVVISPAEDGGYGLLGMKQFHSQLFENKAWGSDVVFSHTLADLNELNCRKKLSFSILPEVWDVDEPEDAVRFGLSNF